MADLGKDSTPPQGVRVTTLGKDIVPDSQVVRLDRTQQTTLNGVAVSVDRRYAPTEDGKGMMSGDFVRIGTGEDMVRLSRIDKNGDGVYDQYTVSQGSVKNSIDDPAIRARLDAAIQNANLVNPGHVVECTAEEASQLSSVGYRAVSDLDPSKSIVL